MAILGSKWFAGGLAGLVVMAVLLLGYRHYTKQLDEIRLLRESQGQLATALDVERHSVTELRGVVEDWAQSRAALEEALDQMQEEAHEARAETRRLRQLFADIDLGSMPTAAADSVADDIAARLWESVQESTRGGEPDRGEGAADRGEAPAAGTSAGSGH